MFIFFILAFYLYIKTPNLFSGDYTLDINPVLLEDDAVFQCQVGAAGEISSIIAKNKVAKISV